LDKVLIHRNFLSFVEPSELNDSDATWTGTRWQAR
jgi:hypothetical protein